MRETPWKKDVNERGLQHEVSLGGRGNLTEARIAGQGTGLSGGGG